MGLHAEFPAKMTVAETNTTAQIEECLNDVNYYKISGTLDRARLATDSQVLVRVGDRVYQAYQTGKDGYCLYLKKADFPAAPVISFARRRADTLDPCHHFGPMDCADIRHPSE